MAELSSITHATCTGAREEVATSYEDLVHLLDVGAIARATGATALNEQSSRSHAIFTIIVEQSICTGRGQQEQHHSSTQNSQTTASSSSGGSGSPLTPRARLLQQLNQSGQQCSPGGDTAAADGSSMPQQQGPGPSSNSSSVAAGDAQGTRWDDGVGAQVEYRCAKFHLVDLAGSERTKRTGAVGARFKETVTINQVGDASQHWPVEGASNMAWQADVLDTSSAPVSMTRQVSRL